MTFQHILYEKQGRIAYVTINRVEVMNSLHPPASRELRSAFEEFRSDPDCRVAVISGQGDKAFCAGFDLKYAASHPYEDPVLAAPFGGITRDWECWKPIIAAVNGYCLGGGLELALACDLIIAAEHARFGLPEVRRGFPPGAGGPQRLIRQIGWKRAMQILLTGDLFTAAQAREFGIVNEAAPLSELGALIDRYIESILDCAPIAVGAAKQMAYEGAHLPYEESLNRSYSEYQKARSSEDAVEGPRAFVEKRRPDWKGR